MKNLRMIAALILVIAAVLVSCGPTYYIPYPFPGTESGEKGDETELDMSWQTEATGTSESDPYVLATVGDVRGLAAMVEAGQDFDGSYFALEPNAEYDFSSIPNFQIGSGDRKDMAGSNVFRGVFDGKGATISGLNIAGGGTGVEDNTPYGFIAVAEGGTIKNLKFEDCVVTSNSSATGIVIGYAENTNIENITVSNSKVSGVEGTGAVAGRLYIGDSNTYKVSDNTVTNVIVESNGSYHAAGVVGYVQAYNGPVVVSDNTVSLGEGYYISSSGDGLAVSGAVVGSIMSGINCTVSFSDNTVNIVSDDQIKTESSVDNTRTGYMGVYDTSGATVRVTIEAADNNIVNFADGNSYVIVDGKDVTASDGQIVNVYEYRN